MNIIIPIGGKGNRFRDDGYSLPKPLIKAKGKPILFWLLDNLKFDNIVKYQLIIVYNKELNNFSLQEIIKNKYPKLNIKFVELFLDTRGAAETVLRGLEALSPKELKDGTLILDCDNFYTEDILGISKTLKSNTIFYFNDKNKEPIFSYILTNSSGQVINIKEKQKISDNANTGAYFFENSKILSTYINKLIDQEKRMELYISYVYKLMIEDGIKIQSFEIKRKNYISLGNPNHLKIFCSESSETKDKFRFCFDLDNTLVTFPTIPGDYSSVKPIKNNIDFLRKLHKDGHYIIIYTARRMKTHSGNVGGVLKDIAKITFDSLEKFDIPYHEIYFGKPYADFYIDDLAINPNNNIEKETGIYYIHNKPREYNHLQFDDETVTKSSDNGSIQGEKYWYEHIPENIREYFPRLISSNEKSITIEKINGIPFAYKYIKQELNISDLTKLLNSIKDIHFADENAKKTNINIYANYIEKLNKRVKSINKNKFKNFDTVLNTIISQLKFYKKDGLGIAGIIHGDPVFSNILITNKNELKFIDMRGMIGKKKTIYGDIFYDYAKIYQSIAGYDYIVHDVEFKKEYMNEFKKEFRNYIINYIAYDEEILNYIYTISSSLLVSLIPLHEEYKSKSFYELAQTILDEQPILEYKY